jgi:hypothetical protein
VGFRQVIRRTIRRNGVAADLHAVVAANVSGRARTRTKVSSRQRVVQRGGRTEVVTEEGEPKDDR